MTHYHAPKTVREAPPQSEFTTRSQQNARFRTAEPLKPIRPPQARQEDACRMLSFLLTARSTARGGRGDEGGKLQDECGQACNRSFVPPRVGGVRASFRVQPCVVWSVHFFSTDHRRHDPADTVPRSAGTVLESSGNFFDIPTFRN